MKILVYDDNPDFGGHQIMASCGIEALASNPSTDVVCMINPSNHKLVKKLADFEQFAPSEKQFRALSPDLVLCIQGDIAQSTNGIGFANRAGIPNISYLALPHRLANMGAKFGALRDLSNQRWINAPDRFIVISDSMKLRLKQRGCKKEIAIVHNGIDPPSPPIKTALNSPLTLGVSGRIEFSQKQQDFMVQTFKKNPQTFKDCQLLIAGSGPDTDQLQHLIRNHADISLLPWQEDIESLYQKIDILIIPSRYEGVPLVMLEALARGIPVIGSACDGMKDILPTSWTFTPRNESSLCSTFTSVQNTWMNKMPALQRKIKTDHTIATFQNNFLNTVLAI